MCRGSCEHTFSIPLPTFACRFNSSTPYDPPTCPAPGTSVWEGARDSLTTQVRVFQWLSHTCLSFHNFNSSPDNSFPKHVQKPKRTCSGGATANSASAATRCLLLPIASATSWASDSQRHSALSSKGFFLFLQWYHTLLKSSTSWFPSLSFFSFLNPILRATCLQPVHLALGDIN